MYTPGLSGPAAGGVPGASMDWLAWPLCGQTSQATENAPANFYGSIYLVPWGISAPKVYWAHDGTQGGGTTPTVRFAIYQAPGGFDGVANLYTTWSYAVPGTSPEVVVTTLSGVVDIEPGYFFLLWGRESGTKNAKVRVFIRDASQVMTDASSLLPNGSLLGSFKTGIAVTSTPASTFTPGKSATITGPDTTNTIAQLGFTT